MPEISILMNCFNCRQYLREAMDSVFSQTIDNWELVFVDNCSTDDSVEIARSYGDKVKIVKTEQNIPLGAARNFGISNCSGDYISVLDTDDIWLPNTLEKQLCSIKSGNYALVYGGQLNINSNGDQIGKMIPKEKAGNIFNELLLQYDIPIVTAMISKKHLTESTLEFDHNITASEEYCLFMQLSARYEVMAIPEALVKYRIHDNSLTNKSIVKWAAERRYTLNKIINDNPGIQQEHKKGFDEAYARAGYYDAQYYMSIDDYKSAIGSIEPYRFQSMKYFLIFILLKFFRPLWKKLQSLKYGRNI